MIKYLLVTLGVLLGFLRLEAQVATLVGKVETATGEALVGASVVVEGSSIGTTTDGEGKYSLKIPSTKLVVIEYSYVGFKVIKKVFENIKDGAILRLDVKMELENEMATFEVRDRIGSSEIDALIIKPEELARFPNPSGSIEQVLQFIAPGVSSGPGGELTSQYSVRGGSYDENLVYVNGFEIYRPLLVRNGQQEGLTFANGNLVRAFTFSTGGFSSMYGDKMSSVLDIRYKRPTKMGASLEGSLLGGSAHIEGAIVKKKDKGKDLANPERLSYLFGARYKTNQLLLNSTSLQGEYVPVFIDIQGGMTYDISRRWQWEVLGNYNYSKFQLLPREFSSTTGLFNLQLGVDANFSGAEQDYFKTSTAATSLTFQPTNKTNLRALFSYFQTQEDENIDLISLYKLSIRDANLGSDNPGQSLATIGYGETQQYVRNSLRGGVLNAELRGSTDLGSEKKYKAKGKNSLETRYSTHFIQWGAKIQNERIEDRTREWLRLDSLGYTVPFDTSVLSFKVPVSDSRTSLNSMRYSGFLQNTWTLKNHASEFRINAGVRANYWTLNNELVISPRLQFFYSPRKIVTDTTDKIDGITYKLSVGAYHQPPFFRELRDYYGNVNTNVKSQKSIHFVAGTSFDFRMLGNRKFRFITEAYYKYMWDLVPYDLENVRIRYYGNNMAVGDVKGIDFRLNGELVKDAESWINLSFLSAREKFDGVQHLERFLTPQGKIDTNYVDYVGRPTDQSVIFSMFFQDYLPKAPWMRLNLSLTIGTGIPFGLPGDNAVVRNIYRYQPYHRLDAGFSFSLWDKEKYEARRAAGAKTKDQSSLIRSFKKLWLSFEVFNLLEVENVASNTWVRDFNGASYAIPNRLSSRRLNIRLRAEF